MTCRARHAHDAPLLLTGARAPPFDREGWDPFDCEVFRVNLTPVTRGISFLWKSTFCTHKTQQAKASKLVLLWFCSVKKDKEAEEDEGGGEEEGCSRVCRRFLA
jgi:hypothetical protein